MEEILDDTERHGKDDIKVRRIKMRYYYTKEKVMVTIPPTINDIFDNYNNYEFDKANNNGYNRTTTVQMDTVLNPNTLTLSCADAPIEYISFQIPKRSGGMREITAPCDKLKETQTDILVQLNNIAPYVHDAAYAYCTGRCCKDSLIEHQQHGSRWFLKIDLKNFFPSLSQEFVKQQLTQVYPFCAMTTDALTPLDYCFYQGVLPQGAPTSPKLSNLVMIPFDYEITKNLGYKFKYTRYADDILISAPFKFDYENIVKRIEHIFKGTPLKVNKDKTRFGSIAGSNWNLGMVLNKDNNITVGNKRKRYLKTSLHNYTVDKLKGIKWSSSDLSWLLGELQYILKIEPDFKANLNTKFPRIRESIIQDLKV